MGSERNDYEVDTLPPAPSRTVGPEHVADEVASAVTPQPQLRSPTRVPCCFDAKIRCASGRIRGIVGNLSTGGMFVTTSELLPLDTEVECEVELPAGRLTAQGHVHWVRPDRFGCTDELGMGIRFLPLADGDAELILDLVLETTEPVLQGY